MKHREEFEAWFKSVYKRHAGKRNGNLYMDYVASTSWVAWHASRDEYFEALKPECCVYRIQVKGSLHEWAVSGTTVGFPTEAEARKWARDNGYRVEQ